ncbi:MAG: helix-turn-helix domain-containing protein [Paenisporosarcina sp.]
MSEYLVRWKFGPNSLLNHRDVETGWFQEWHPDKESAVIHYTSILMNRPRSEACTVEIFQMVKLIPGQPEPEDIQEILGETETRNKRIMEMREQGYQYREIATATGLSYQTVYSIVRRLSDVK